MGGKHTTIINTTAEKSSSPVLRRSAGFAEPDASGQLPAGWYLLPAILAGTIVWIAILWMVS
jgi:hypothetical protein